MRAHKNNQAATLTDQVDTLVALADGCLTTNDVRRKIDSVFSDDAKGVVFSSGHRAKGAEADNVYYYMPELVPHKLAVEPWQLQAEENVDFVMSTRSKHGLYFTSAE
jgi:superfamily I DNA and RNA helicase